jgi:hypothetical protein
MHIDYDALNHERKTGFKFCVYGSIDIADITRVDIRCLNCITTITCGICSSDLPP